MVLGRFDNSLNFDKVVINGKTVSNLKAGQVVLDFPAGNVGTQKSLENLSIRKMVNQNRFPLKVNTR